MDTEIDNTYTADDFSICITQYIIKNVTIHHNRDSNSMINPGSNDIGLKPFVDELCELCNICNYCNNIYGID